MRNLFHKTTAALAMCSLVLGSAASAYADKTFDFGAMELDKTYTYEYDPEVATVMGTFTAENDMLLVMTYDSEQGDWLVPCKNADHSEEYIIDKTPDNKLVFIQMTAGETAYLYKSWVMGSFTVRLADGNIEPKITGLLPDPAQNPNFSIGSDFSVTFDFNLPVEAKSAEVRCGDLRADASVMSHASTILNVSVKSVLTSWLRQGSIKAGDEFTVAITDVAPKHNPDKTFEATATYKIMGMPVQLVSTTFGGKNLVQDINSIDFLSYYMPDAEDGVLVLEFDGDIMPLDNKSQTMSSSIAQGYIEVEGKFHMENLRPVTTIDGKTITIDFRGKLRDIATFHQGSVTQDDVKNDTDGAFKTMTISVSSIKGADGQFVLTFNDWSIGSYAYVLDYKEITADIVTAYYNLENGRQLISGAEVKAGDKLEIYVEGLNNLMFSGLEFAYETESGNASTTIAKESLEFAKEDDADLIHFTFPELEGAKENSPVHISFADLVSIDGQNHEADVCIDLIYAKSTGIADVVAGNQRVDVIGIDGRVVLRNADASMIGGLEKGLYIIGGKKVLVK